MIVIPMKIGIQKYKKYWIPAFAGMASQRSNQLNRVGVAKVHASIPGRKHAFLWGLDKRAFECSNVTFWRWKIR
jgi:hypothetical protein